MANVGIIAAAGSATRFDGVVKELLPIDAYKCALDTQLIAMQYAGVRDIYVVTIPEKTTHYALRFKNKRYRDSGIFPRVVVLNSDKTHGPDLWETLGWSLENLASKDGYTFIGLADTIIPPDTYSKAVHKDNPDGAGIILGVFDTTTPNRFSTVVGNTIYTKVDMPVPAKAWGAIVLSPPASEYLGNHSFMHYDQALQSAINIYGLETVDMQYYHDVGTFSWYVDYLRKES